MDIMRSWPLLFGVYLAHLAHLAPLLGPHGRAADVAGGVIAVDVMTPFRKILGIF